LVTTRAPAKVISGPLSGPPTVIGLTFAIYENLHQICGADSLRHQLAGKAGWTAPATLSRAERRRHAAQQERDEMAVVAAI